MDFKVGHRFVDGEIENAMADAEIALDVARANPEEKVVGYHSQMRENARRKKAFLDAFVQGLDDGEIVPHYQSIISLNTGALSGMEAFARWNRPERGSIGPQLFMDALHDEKIAGRVGAAIFDGICEDMRRWRQMGVHFGRVGYNISPRELDRKDLVVQMLSSLNDFGLRPRNLVLEVSEDLMAQSLTGHRRAAMQQLHDSDVTIALTNYGMGQIPMSLLGELPFNILKLSKDLVSDITTAETSRHIAHSAIAIGKNVGYTTVAEGVETQEQASALRALGCGSAQGYLFDRPMSAPDISARLVALRHQSKPESAQAA